MIEVTGLYKKYGNHLAVKNVSFKIDKGEIIGFLGPNGAGKSTTMNMITGYLSLTRGSIKIDGFDITEEPEKAKARIGYLPELPPLYADMKVREYLYFIYDLKKVKFPKKAHIDEIMRLVGLTEYQNRLIKFLSKGYRQRVGFAQALVGNPDVLILDEPTVGLDPKQIIEIRNLIEKLGENHTIILSSHILSEIQAVCKRVIIINKGQLVADGNLEELSSKISKNNKFTLKAVGVGEKFADTLSKIEGVVSAEFINDKNGEAEFSVVPEEQTDIRAELSQAVIAAGGKILELSPNTITLEQIFLRLTENADNKEAIKALGDNDNITESEESEDEGSI